MFRNNKVLVFLFILFIGLIFLGNYYNEQRKVEQIESYKAFVARAEEKALKDKLAEEELNRIKEKEAKEIYTKHENEGLIYVPMGDSITVGWDALSKEASFVSILSELIEEKMGYDVLIKDVAAYAGTGLKDNGLPNVHKVIDEEPDFITIAFGTNDMYKHRESAYLTPIEFEEKLTELIDIIKLGSSDTELLLLTTWHRDDESYIYDNVIKKVGENYGIGVVDISGISVRDDTKGPIGNYTPFRDGQSDHWHPNDLGHKLIAETVFEQAYEVLK